MDAGIAEIALAIEGGVGPVEGRVVLRLLQLVAPTPLPRERPMCSYIRQVIMISGFKSISKA